MGEQKASFYQVDNALISTKFDTRVVEYNFIG
jgi:hypothetical protein